MTTIVQHNKKTYRVAPSQFGGFSVVELRGEIAVPVRNPAERERVIAKAKVAA